jgi:hypothetical protein
MKTGGYDVLMEINERLVNHALAAAFYSSFYTTFEGTVVPQVGGPFSGLARVDYHIELNEPPLIDFMPPDRMRAHLDLKAIIKVIGRKVRTDVSVDLMGRMALDPITKEIALEVQDVKLGELRFLDRYELPKIARVLVNEALMLAIHSNIVKGIGVGGLRKFNVPVTAAPDIIHLGDEIRIALLPGFPGMTIKIPSVAVEVSSLVPAETLQVGEVDMAVFPGFFGVISDQSMAVAISMGESVVGDPASIKDFTEGNDIAIGLSEVSLNRILDQVWTQVPRDLKVNGNIPVDNIRELLDSLRSIKDMPSRFETLGLNKKNTEVEKAWVDFSAIVNPEKPKVRMGEGGTFEMYDTRVPAKAKATVMATEVTTLRKGRNAFSVILWGEPAEEKPPETKKEEVTIYNFDSDIEILLKRAVVTLGVDKEGRLKVDITDVDFYLDIPWHLPKFVLEGISNRIEETIKKDFPAFDLTEMLHEKLVSVFPFTPQLKIVKVSTEGSEALIIGNLEFKEVPRHIVPVPSFVADPRTAKREVHRASCPSVRKIPEHAQVGYTSLYDALAEGLRGARDCLPEFSQGLVEREMAVTIPQIDVSLVPPSKENVISEEGLLKPIPIVEVDVPILQEKIEISSGEETADGASHEIKGEEHEDRAATGKKDTVPPTR